MNKTDVRLISILLVIIIICSLTLIIKILNQKNYDEKLYAEIYNEYNEIFGDNSEISEIEKNVNDDVNKTSYYMKKTENGNYYKVIASITIPKISKSYPVISETTDEYLKIAPCKLWGGDPNEVGNFSVIGHNYKNDQFFSKISTLDKGDKVYLTSIGGKTLEYKVFDKFEVRNNDFSCTEASTDGTTDLTLITCSNIKSKKYVVKCRAK